MGQFRGQHQILYGSSIIGDFGKNTRWDPVAAFGENGEPVYAKVEVSATLDFVLDEFDCSETDPDVSRIDERGSFQERLDVEGVEILGTVTVGPPRLD